MTLSDTLNILNNPAEKRVMIASHRGKFGSSVMENTVLAFQIALGQRADMVEMDLQKTKDGRIVAHHDDTLERLFHVEGRIGDKTLEELQQMEIYNCFAEPCVEKIETFDEILKALKDQAILVLDKCWDCWDDVYELLCRYEMADQAVFKFYIEDEQAMKWAEKHQDCMFIPMLGNTEYIESVLRLKEKTKVPGLEILPEKETDAVYQDETIKLLHDHGIKIWCNSLSLSSRLVYGAGNDDIKALRYGGDFAWGILIQKGVDIIQTDWPHELYQYLQGNCK